MDILTELTKSRLFNGIAIETIAKLIHTGKEVHLENEEVLFHQGDIADSFYIVLSGRLLAILESGGKSQVVTDIFAGDVIGEVTLLSSNTRSMTITAAMPSKLLKISKKTMIRFCFKYPRMPMNIVNILAERSTQTLKLLSTAKQNRYISLIKLGDAVKYTDFFASLIDKLSQSNRTTVTKRPSTETEAIINYPSFLNYLAYQLGHNKEELFHELDLNQSFFSRCFTENATHEIIFVPAHADVKILSEYGRVGNIFKRKKHMRRSLVLLYENNDAKPKYTNRWLKAGDFTSHYHIRLNNQADLDRLVRFLLGRANGLVISGGAARSLIGVGGIKAILEKNIPIDAVGGTSMGAVITALFAMSDDYASFEQRCKQIVNSLKFWNKIRSFTWPLVSIYNGTQGTREIQKICGDLHIEDLWYPYFSVSCNYSDLIETVHDRGLLWEAARATSALPGLVPPCVIDGRLHGDGGLTNNFPTDIMRDIVGENGLIIGINSSTSADVAKAYKFPPEMPFFEALFTALGWRHRDYVYPSIMDILMKALFMAAVQRTLANREFTDILIEPDLRKYFFSDFKPYQEILDIGYKDTIKMLDKYSQQINRKSDL
jgi:predicted acylesterase/phospholipase RssA/CRP-like cAMP-binding protein